MRAGAYSPNHIGNDAAILNGVVEQLRKRGCDVKVYSEDNLNQGVVDEDVIVNMCREPQSISLLQEYERKGKLVINSGFGIENCQRERMTRLLIGNGVPYPDSLIVDTNVSVVKKLRDANFKGAWIKRGDGAAMHREDVSYVRHEEEAQEVLHEYFLRGISRAVINKHLPGDLIKFYGVAGTDFFYWFYPFDEGHSKYGLEVINGKSRGLKFSLEHFKSICDKASEVLDVMVYGGDCVVDENGDVRIIDFNDWPSFAPCRDQAAPIIAKAIYTKIKQHGNKQ